MGARQSAQERAWLCTRERGGSGLLRRATCHEEARATNATGGGPVMAAAGARFAGLRPTRTVDRPQRETTAPRRPVGACATRIRYQIAPEHAIGSLLRAHLADAGDAGTVPCPTRVGQHARTTPSSSWL